MDYFEHPIDSKTLLRKKKKIKKELLAEHKELIKKRIAVLGGSTTDEVVDQLELFLLNYGIEGKFYQSEYGKYYEDAIFENEKLNEFSPEIFFIHTNWRNIKIFPSLQNSEDEIKELLESEYQKFVRMWETIKKRYNCPIIQNNFDRPDYRLLGNKDISDIHGRTNYITRLNQMFYGYSYNNSYIYINDIDYLAAEYGLSNWANPLYWHMYKYALSIDAIPYLASSVAKIIKAIYGKNKKVLALDLDNTLWGGIIGDDGVGGIAIGPETPNGQAYSEFQMYCKKQKDIGIVLAIDSKNDEENAIVGLNHPDGDLKPDDFVSIKANWESKDKNILDMANELSLGIDSFVFIDDNPAEREIVRKQLPGVAVPEVEKINSFISVIDHSGFFEVVNLSTEDSKKTELYRAKTQAERSLATFSDYGEYLDNLAMKAIIRPFEEIYVSRITQLTNKSNQFNLTTLRCSEDDIRKMMQSSNWITLYGKLEDKFCDNGIVTIVAGEIKGMELHIRLWLMSCRVLKRGMEDAMMDALMKRVMKQGIKTIYGYYHPTAKNNMVKDFYEKMSFEQCEPSTHDHSVWRLNVNHDYVNKNVHINIITA